MDTTAMDEILAGMSPVEIWAALPFIDELEVERCVSPDEAAEWRRRILAWRSLMELTTDLREL
jgi:hypothetical protein